MLYCILIECLKAYSFPSLPLTATAYGVGVYFATASSYSTGYTSQDSSGTRHMIQARVLVGEYTTGNSGMRALPVRSGTRTYDSAVNSTSNPTMYIIFHDAQAYPEYIISFWFILTNELYVYV